MAVAAQRMERLDVEAHAAWVRGFAKHRQIRVRPGGVLETDTDGRSAGSVFVTVRVPSVDAAEVAAVELFEAAGLDQQTWDQGWRGRDGSLEITIYPTPVTFVADGTEVQEGGR